MAIKTSDFFVERLKSWGVTRIYGYPGDGIDGLLGALQRAAKDGEGIEFIQVRHEEMAAFMATAHAKLTGELGVCLSTGGPGATHLLTGLYDARIDHVPVLAIVGQAETTSRGASYQQELNLDRLFADVAAFVQEAAVPAQVRHVLDRGIRVALARNSVAAVILPKDVQDAPWGGRRPSPTASPAPASVTNPRGWYRRSRNWRARCGAGDYRRGGHIGGGRSQGAARQRCAAGRFAVCHRRHWSARYTAVFGY